jgi:hypothetical protein
VEPLPVAKLQEEYSVAFVHALAVAADVVLERIHVDYFGTDVQLKARGGREPRVELQLKTVQLEDVVDEYAWIVEDASEPHYMIGCEAGRNGSWVNDRATLSFRMEDDQFNALVGRKLVPKVLAVVLIPHDRSRWALQTPTELLLRAHGYWVSLERAERRTGEGKHVVRLPAANRLTPAAIRDILELIDAEQWPPP